LVPLEKLAGVEEVAVRDRAVESITKVIEVISKDQFEGKVVPLVRRLCAGQWFTSKCAACALLPVVYAKCTPAEQKELLTSFVALSKDSAPMVRRAAVQSLGPLAKISGKDNTEKVLLPVFNTLCRDDQVRRPVRFAARCC
jgi:serine/threonine-protein phosphatase 2A regulatory subunit A